MESRLMLTMLLLTMTLLLLLLTLSFSAMLFVVFSANACYNDSSSYSYFIIAWCKIFLLCCWRVISFRFFFCYEIDWMVCGCGCGAGGADGMNVINLNLTFMVFIRVIRPLIISINWSIFASINRFRVNIISTDLMKESIIALIVDTSMSFKRFF